MRKSESERERAPRRAHQIRKSGRNTTRSTGWPSRRSRGLDRQMGDPDESFHSAGGRSNGSLRRRAPSKSSQSRSLLSRRHAEEGERTWSTSKHVCVAVLFLAGLWIFCLASSAMLIEALLRVTS